MEFQVNTNNVILSKINQVESGEYNVTECRFIFSSEYEGLTKIAVFTGANGDAYKITILNNKCEIPSELLTESQIVQIGVYAYEVQGTEFVLRYSPIPTRFMIEKGSYVVNAVNMSRPTPTEVEQLQSQITHNANDIEDLQQTVSEHTTDISNIQSDINDIKAEQTEQNTNIQKNTDDIVNINQAIDTINTDITDIDSAISNINEDIDNLEQDLTNYSLITETGSQINLNVNSTNYQITAILKDKNGNVIYTSNAIDLPIESMIINASYDNTTKEIVLTLQNGQTIRFSVADLVNGLVSEDDLQTILANYYTKTEINNLLNNKVDKVQGKGLSEVDFTTAKDEKLEGIEAEANKTIVDNELDNTSENPVQNKVIYEALSEKQTQINNLQTDVEDLRNASLKVTGIGTDITLNNTAKGRLLKNDLSGRTEQATSKIVYICDGSETGDYYLTYNNINYQFTMPTVLSGDILVFNTTTLVLSLNNTEITTETGTTGTQLTFIATPNPDFLIPIKNVTGNANEKIQNKNLFNPNGEFENGFYSTDGEFYPNSSWRCMTVKCKQGDIFTRSGGSWGGIVTFWNNGTFISGFNSYSLTITIPSGVNEVKFACRYPFTGDEQLEYGTTATSYVPHQEQNYPFTFAEGQFLADNEKLQDNGMLKKWKQVTFSGTTITLEDAKSNGAYFCNKKVAGNLVGQTLTFDEEVTNAVIQYELAEPDIIPYNATQQAQYNAKKEASSYDDITYISSESDELGFDMNVVAVADANKVIENQNNEIDTIKSRLDLLEG